MISQGIMMACGKTDKMFYKANVAKQIINKKGQLVWKAETLRDCPIVTSALADGGVVMVVGVDSSHSPSFR